MCVIHPHLHTVSSSPSTLTSFFSHWVPIPLTCPLVLFLHLLCDLLNLTRVSCKGTDVELSSGAWESSCGYITKENGFFSTSSPWLLWASLGVSWAPWAPLRSVTKYFGAQWWADAMKLYHLLWIHEYIICHTCNTVCHILLPSTYILLNPNVNFPEPWGD